MGSPSATLFSSTIFSAKKKKKAGGGGEASEGNVWNEVAANQEGEIRRHCQVGERAQLSHGPFSSTASAKVLRGRDGKKPQKMGEGAERERKKGDNTKVLG